MFAAGQFGVAEKNRFTGYRVHFSQGYYIRPVDADEVFIGQPAFKVFEALQGDHRLFAIGQVDLGIVF